MLRATALLVFMSAAFGQEQVADSVAVLDKLRDVELAKESPDYLSRVNLAVRYEGIGKLDRALELLNRKEPSDPADQSGELPVFRKMTQPVARARALEAMVRARIGRKDIDGAIELLGLMDADWHRYARLPAHSDFDPISRNKLWATWWIVGELAVNGETTRAMAIVNQIDHKRYRDNVRSQTIGRLLRSKHPQLAAKWIRTVEGYVGAHYLATTGMALADADDVTAAIEFAKLCREKFQSDLAAMQILMSAAASESRSGNTKEARSLINETRSLFNDLLDRYEDEYLPYWEKGRTGQVAWAISGSLVRLHPGQTSQAASHFSVGLHRAGRTNEAARVAGTYTSIMMPGVCSSPGATPTNLLLTIMEEHLAKSEFGKAERVLDHFVLPVDRNMGRTILASRLMELDQQKAALRIAAGVREWMIREKPDGLPATIQFASEYGFYGMASPRSVFHALCSFYHKAELTEDLNKLKAGFIDRPQWIQWAEQTIEGKNPPPTEYRVNSGFGNLELQELPVTPDKK